MSAIGVILARLLGARITLPFAVVCLIAQPVPAQQQPAAPEILQYKGTVAAALEGEVAPRLDGLLTKINFKAGQLVNKGDVLFEFATRDKELTLAMAQATLKQAEAQLRLAEVDLKNKETLQTRNVGSEMQFLQAQAQRDIAAAKAEEAGVNVQLAEVALQQMKLYAPITGIVSRSLVREGAYITKEARDQSRLATVAQLDPIHVAGRAPAAMYFQRGEVIKSVEQAAENREFGLILPTGDKYPHKGRLVAGTYEFDPQTQTTEVTVEFPNPEYLLRPGLDVTLQSSIRDK
jgi:membrane fusion protein (multidrug efflux system)